MQSECRQIITLLLLLICYSLFFNQIQHFYYPCKKNTKKEKEVAVNIRKNIIFAGQMINNGQTKRSH